MNKWQKTFLVLAYCFLVLSMLESFVGHSGEALYLITVAIFWVVLVISESLDRVA